MTPRQHVSIHGGGAYMIIAFHEVSQDEYHDSGRVYDRVVFLGFAPEHTHSMMRRFAARFPETAHLAVAPAAAERWVIEDLHQMPFIRLGGDWESGWSVRVRDSLFQLEPETSCGICGWSPYEVPPERGDE